MFFFSRLPRSRLGSLAFAVLTCFLLVGMVASTSGGIRGASRSTASSGSFSLIQVPWVPVYLGSCFWSYCFRQVQVVAAPAAPPVLHILRLPGFPRKLRLRGC